MCLLFWHIVFVVHVIKCSVCNIKRRKVYWPCLCYSTALPQQKSQRGKVATVYQHTWTVSYQPLEHKVQHTRKQITRVISKQNSQDCNSQSVTCLCRGKPVVLSIIFHIRQHWWFLFTILPSICHPLLIFLHLFLRFDVFSANCCQLKRIKTFDGTKSTLSQQWALWRNTNTTIAVLGLKKKKKKPAVPRFELTKPGDVWWRSCRVTTRGQNWEMESFAWPLLPHY